MFSRLCSDPDNKRKHLKNKCFLSEPVYQQLVSFSGIVSVALTVLESGWPGAVLYMYMWLCGLCSISGFLISFCSRKSLFCFVVLGFFFLLCCFFPPAQPVYLVPCCRLWCWLANVTHSSHHPGSSRRAAGHCQRRPPAPEHLPQETLLHVLFLLPEQLKENTCVFWWD